MCRGDICYAGSIAYIGLSFRIFFALHEYGRIGTNFFSSVTVCRTVLKLFFIDICGLDSTIPHLHRPERQNFFAIGGVKFCRTELKLILGVIWAYI